MYRNIHFARGYKMCVVEDMVPYMYIPTLQVKAIPKPVISAGTRVYEPIWKGFLAFNSESAYIKDAGICAG
jgi:hypothetical protein